MTNDIFGGSDSFLSSLDNIIQQLSTSQTAEDPRITALKQNYAKNQAYAQQAQSYQTQLPQTQEQGFQAWVKQNQIPFNPNQNLQDYDMRGFWLALQKQDPRAVSAIDPNDSKIHYPDYWKTPYHETFSNESQWATKGAPSWNNKDQLIDSSGKVLFDDRAKKK